MAEIYRVHGGLVYRFCLRMVQDPSVAEEVTQDVFLAFLKQAGSFDSQRAALSTWLCAIARRMVWKQLERQRRHPSFDVLEGERELKSPDDDPGVLQIRREEVAAVQRGLEALPPDAREVIVLCEFEELSYEAAALIIGVPVGTVRSRLHRAKARLAALLQNHSLHREGRLYGK